ncbi:MAG: hypothetical protein E7384_00895 [Ruminococcaceae bacterium]|nr:hypothetical protein [Oscillospiraceae bacterium]
MKVFFSVQEEAVEDICECGLKVSEYKNRTVSVNGNLTSFIAAKLNPNDLEKADGCMIIRFIPDDSHCFIAEGAFYDEHILCVQSGGDDFWLKKYEDTIVPVSQYKLGQYRNPDYLIGRTLFAEQIEIFDIRKGEPILYSNSEELYIGKSVRTAEEMREDFYEIAVEAVCSKEGLTVLDGQKYRIYKDTNGAPVFIAKK